MTYAPVRGMLKGGRIHNQLTRQTSDIDVQFARTLSSSEIHQIFSMMNNDLGWAGIKLEEIKGGGKIEANGSTGVKLKITCGLGGPSGEYGKRVNLTTNLTGGGLFPKYQQSVKATHVLHTTMVPVICMQQSFESQCADKIHAIATRPDTTRWKDYPDVLLLKEMGVDARIVADELRFKTEMLTGLSCDKVLEVNPVALSHEFAESNLNSFCRWYEKHHSGAKPVDFRDLSDEVYHYYAEIRDRIVAVTLPKPGRDIQAKISMKQQAARIDEMRAMIKSMIDGTNVIKLDERRHQSPAYRPR